VLHKNADQLRPFTALDGCLLAEVLHPTRDPIAGEISLARACLPPGKSTTPHRLEFLEIYYVLRGRGVLHQDGHTQEVGPESCVYLPPGSRQWIENTGSDELVFLCVCHPAWRAEGDHPA
jgi:mannose-6-phosphate isomerase-like protein (cupin superfamily)